MMGPGHPDPTGSVTFKVAVTATSNVGEPVFGPAAGTQGWYGEWAAGHVEQVPGRGSVAGGGAGPGGRRARHDRGRRGERPGTTSRTAAVCGRIRALLQDAEEHANGVRPARLRWLQDWRGGGPIERAWRNLHSAEILLAEVIGLGELSSQRPAVRSMAKRVLPAKDARSQAIEQWLSDKDVEQAPRSATTRRVRRSCVASTSPSLTWVNDACDKNFTRVRSFRNVVLAASVGLAVVAIGLGAIGVFTPSSLPLCFDAGSLTAETPAAKAPGQSDRVPHRCAARSDWWRRSARARGRPRGRCVRRRAGGAEHARHVDAVLRAGRDRLAQAACRER